MGVDVLEILKQPSNDLNTLTYNDYYNRLALLANTIFEWEGLPNGIPERFIERVLFQYGQCAFFYDDEFGFMASKCTLNDRLNFYDEPIGYVCYSNVYHKEYSADDCIIIRNNAFCVPTSSTIRLFASRLAEVERIIDVNIKAQKTPLIIVTDEKQRLTMKNLMKQFDGNTPFIFGNKGLQTDAIKAIKTDVPFLADQLMIYKHDLWNDAMSFLGIANANTDKRERLVTDEVNANNHLVALSANVMYKQRKEACEQINEKYGLDVNVKMRSVDDVFAQLAPAMESNVDSKFSSSYIFTGKEGD